MEQIRELRPEVALIDIGMPDKDGLEVTRALYQDVPEVKVIILGMPDLTDEIMACIEAGAAGYVLMKKIKVLLSSRPKLLSEVIRNMIERQPGMEVAGEVIDPIELLRAARATMVDAVIVTPLE